MDRGAWQSMDRKESDTTEQLTLLLHFSFYAYQYQLLFKKRENRLCAKNNNNQWWKNRQSDQLSRIGSQKQTHINKVTWSLTKKQR